VAGGRDRCRGCNHPERDQLDADLVSGVSERDVGKRYGLAKSTVHRHRAHVALTLVRVGAPHPGRPLGSNGHGPALASSDDVLAAVRRIYEQANAELERALPGGNALTIALAMREVRGALDQLAKQVERAELRRGAAVVDLATLPSFVAMRTKMVHALAAFPEARIAVADVLDLEEDET
jgi:hypothetical protein